MEEMFDIIYETEAEAKYTKPMIVDMKVSGGRKTV
jgi:hypothetical protein